MINPGPSFCSRVLTSGFLELARRSAPEDAKTGVSELPRGGRLRCLLAGRKFPRVQKGAIPGTRTHAGNLSPKNAPIAALISRE